MAKNVNGPLVAKSIYGPPMAKNIYGPPMAKNTLMYFYVNQGFIDFFFIIFQANLQQWCFFKNFAF